MPGVFDGDLLCLLMLAHDYPRPRSAGFLMPNNKSKSDANSDAESGTWVYVDQSAEAWKNMYGAMAPWQRELVARKWLKKQNFFWSPEHRVVNSFFMHLAACCRQPAGRADGTRGSQQCCFEMEVTDIMALGILRITGVHFEVHKKSRYSINADSQIAWIEAKTIDSFYMDNADKMSKWISFETRAASKHLNVFGSSKGVVQRDEGVKVIATLIPPFIIELCHRPHDRLVLAVTCNLFTFNDLGGLDMPPDFPYAEGERGKFHALATKNLMGMLNNNIELSKLMRRLLPPAYRAGEDEGEEMEMGLSSEEEN